MIHEFVFAVILVLAVGIAFRVLLFISWHRRGFRWPDEDQADYVEFSPRFVELAENVYHDTEMDRQLFIATTEDGNRTVYDVTTQFEQNSEQIRDDVRAQLDELRG